MSCSNKTQSKGQQQPEPPRYQPPPQPSSPVVKSSVAAGAGGATTTSSSASSSLLTAKQLHQMHQQQAAKLASQVKDAVQTKFQPHKLDRTDKLQGGFGLHQPKSYLPSGIPTPTATTPTALTATTNAQQQQQQQQQQQHLGGVGGGGLPIANVPLNGLQQPAAAAASRQRISDDEFLRLGPVEMLKFVRKTESDIARLVAEQHRQIQALVNELRALKEANQRLSDDNQELRDLCCFLDDDRQKGRKLAREWQRFGRYTASVMRQEVSAYQNKLRQLDNKQQELIKDNLELKELCLYLDEERGGGQRDDGDGSSSSTNADESAPAPTRIPRHAASTFNDQMMQYVRSLEQRIKQLEEDKSALQARAQQGWTSNEPWDNQRNVDDCHLGSRPEAVVRALQVLEVREQLEREAGHDGEKALVREMCNVVWRKLEEGPAQNRH